MLACLLHGLTIGALIACPFLYLMHSPRYPQFSLCCALWRRWPPENSDQISILNSTSTSTGPALPLPLPAQLYLYRPSLIFPLLAQSNFPSTVPALPLPLPAQLYLYRPSFTSTVPVYLYLYRPSLLKFQFSL